jgi:acetyl esterase/lipase
VSVRTASLNFKTQELEKNPIREPKPSDPYYGRKDHAASRAHRATILREKHHLRYLPGPIPEVSEEDRQIPMRDGAEITVRVYRPTARPPAAEGRGSPLIVMFHEGGFSMGDLTDEEVNCRLFSRELGAVCVNVDYRYVS